MALLDTLAGELLGTKSVNTLSKSTGAETSQVQQVVTAALPLLISAMNQNASTEDGAAALSTALDQHAGKAKASTSTMLKEADPTDGKKIVKHVLGDKTSDVTKGLAKKTGLTSAQVTTILATLAPVVLSLLGNHKTETNAASTSSDLTGMLSSVLLGNNSGKGAASGLDFSSLASALLGGEASGSTGNVAGTLIGSLLGGSSSDSGNSTASIAGNLIGSLLGGSGSSTKTENTSDALSSILGSLLK